MVFRASKGLVPKLVAVGVKPHDPKIVIAIISAGLGPARPGNGAAAYDNAAIAGQLRTPREFIVISAVGSVPKLLAIGVQSDHPKVTRWPGTRTVVGRGLVSRNGGGRPTGKQKATVRCLLNLI